MMASSQDKSLPDNCIVTDLPGLAGKRWVKGVALYGANASGKTTVIEALKTLAVIVEGSARMTDPKEPISQIEPFALAPGEPESPTAFAVAFVADGVRYEYRVAATRERIWHESLRAFPTAKEQLWFSRDWNAESDSYAWSPERPTGFRRDSQLEGYTLSNMLFLSKAVANNRTELEPVFRWFKERLNFLDLSAQSTLGLRFTVEKIREETPFRDRIVKLLRYADLGVTGARIIEKRPPEGVEKMLKNLGPVARESILMDRWTKPELTHRGSGATDLPLPWASESAGTHRFFGLAGPWLDILSNGYTVCVDELETSIHPLMVRELLRLIFNSTENPHGAQILFTTHNPLLLDATLLRRDQVWFTDKDAAGEAHLYPLTDYQPRKGESLVRGYLSGRYGAVPFIPSGLLGSFQVQEAPPQPEKAAHE
ncbi:MAG TPA: ATP-binding protein [Candidatus Acidoferrum sp.]|nr:ATP-binding protein [Candidatus Acidoferrum sp.]